LLAIQRLHLPVEAATIEEFSKKCVASAAPQPIVIDGHDPSHYKVAA
jgi:hypothetical protein